MRLVFCRNSFLVTICNKCGYGEYQYQLNNSQLELYYKNIYDKVRGRETPLKSYYTQESNTLSERVSKQINFLENAINKEIKGKVLEIGAGNAEFSRFLIERNKSNKCEVIDPNNIWEKFYQKYN